METWQHVQELKKKVGDLTETEMMIVFLSNTPTIEFFVTRHLAGLGSQAEYERALDMEFTVRIGSISA
jgi:hypothetical protein